MGSRTWVLKDPNRHEQCLALLRDGARLRVIDIATSMSLSVACVRDLVYLLKDQGKVDTTHDITRRKTPRSGAPLVAWIRTAETEQPKQPTPKPDWFMKCGNAEYVHPYAPTGTPAHLAGRIQMMAVQGRAA